MAQPTHTHRTMAQKDAFRAFGILYYPLFRSRAELPSAVSDEDMAWAVTAYTNLEGTGYTLSQLAITTLAAYHHAVMALAHNASFLPLADLADKCLINPLSDLKRLVPDVKASPMYPDFPSQVMEMPEAQYRYDQACHYLSTYGTELVAGLLGVDVTVGEGWMPHVASTPKTEADEALVAPKVLHVLVTEEDLAAVVADRLARATRMHPAEIATALLVFGNRDARAKTTPFPKVAFHENMMELIRMAAHRDSGTLEHVAAGLAQHPGDLLKAVMYVRATTKRMHLSTRQKKGFCRAFEHFDTRAIALNLVDATSDVRQAPNYLSVARFGGPHLREAIELVASGAVRSWASKVESLWGALGEVVDPQQAVDVRNELTRRHEEGLDLPSDFAAVESAWQALLTQYGWRPGMLIRSLSRLVKAGCPAYLLQAELGAHIDAYSLPTLVSTIVALSSPDVSTDVLAQSLGRGRTWKNAAKPMDAQTRQEVCACLLPLIEPKLRDLETPFKGRRVFLDTAGVSLAGSVLRPNEVGETSTAWPPLGIAFDLPQDKTLRFFTFWDDRERRVDVDVHFEGSTVLGERVHIGWNGSYKDAGMVMSGDVTTSHNSVEYLDINMEAAREAGIVRVVQVQHLYSGRGNWGDIPTCYSGALLVQRRWRTVKLYDTKNLLFRDDLSGKGRMMNYAVINVPEHYVRIVRGGNVPLGEVTFSLGDYLDELFRAQGVTLVSEPDEAEVRVCVGRSDDPEVVSLFDEGFFLR